MRARREKDHLALSFNQVESRILRHLLHEVQSHYRGEVETSPGQQTYIWYSTRGCQSADMTPEQTQEWLANMRELKEAAAVSLDRWIEELAPPETTAPTLQAQCRLRLSFEDASTFLTALNDQRLITASRANLGPAELGLESLGVIAHLPEEQRAALMQIDFLEFVMSKLLRILTEQ